MAAACCGGSGGAVDQGGSGRCVGRVNKITKEGTEMPKGGYLLPWTNIYEEYIKFSGRLDKNHPLHIFLTEELKVGNDILTPNLGYLDKYYAEIRHFLNLADTAKRSPNSVIDGFTTVQQALKAKEAELCNFKDTLEPYFYGYRLGLAKLDSIANKIEDYTNKLRNDAIPQYKASDDEVFLLWDLLQAIKSISNKVRVDWEDEVKGGPNDPYDFRSFNAYVKDRRITLLALEGMPPLPPTPGTTG